MEANLASPRTDNQLPLTPSDPTPNDYLDNSFNRSLTVLALNCQSLLAKKESFLNLICFHTSDIIIGCESWLKPDVKNCEIFPSNYNVHRIDRADGYGGIFIACHDSLASCNIQIETSCELVACQIQLPNQPHLIICSLYRPPSSNEAYLNECCHQLESIRHSYPDSVLWITGDVNLPGIDWINNTINSHQYSLNLNQIFLDFLQDNALSQLVNYPTRGSKILDVFITDRPSLVEFCNTIDGISDHEAILVTSYVLAPLGPPIERSIYLWSRANFDHIRQEMQSLCDHLVVLYTSRCPME